MTMWLKSPSGIPKANVIQWQELGLVWFNSMAHQPLWLVNAKSILNILTVPFQSIQLSISLVFCLHLVEYQKFNFKQFSLSLVHSLNDKTDLFQTGQNSISWQFQS